MKMQPMTSSNPKLVRFCVVLALFWNGTVLAKDPNLNKTPPFSRMWWDAKKESALNKCDASRKREAIRIRDGLFNSYRWIDFADPDRPSVATAFPAAVLATVLEIKNSPKHRHLMVILEECKKSAEAAGPGR